MVDAVCCAIEVQDGMIERNAGLPSGRRIEFAMYLRVVLVSAIALLTAPVTAEEQQPSRMSRLCFITFDPVTSRATRFAAFFEELRDLGYVDGKTITIDYFSADGQGELFPTLASECLLLKPDIIAVSTTPAALAAKSATQQFRSSWWRLATRWGPGS